MQKCAFLPGVPSCLVSSQNANPLQPLRNSRLSSESLLNISRSDISWHPECQPYPGSQHTTSAGAADEIPDSSCNLGQTWRNQSSRKQQPSLATALGWGHFGAVFTVRRVWAGDKSASPGVAALHLPPWQGRRAGLGTGALGRARSRDLRG